MRKDGYETIRFLRYMGTKAPILDFIIPKIRKEVREGDIVFDLMAGTHSVGYALKPWQTIYANDIQAYSYVIGQALIENNNINVSRERAIEDLQDNIASNMKFIGEYIRSSKPKTPGSEGFYLQVKKGYNSDHKKVPYILFTAYSTNTYFSGDQCKMIDSIRYSIDQVKKQKKALYLTCLLYAISQSVANTGHFAEFKQEQGDVLKIRKLGPLELFLNKCDDVKIRFNGRKNKCFNCDYRDFFENPKFRKEISKAELIYLDPPYSTLQYSRFYHIPETLVLYDYPNRDYKGQYRGERHQSNFGRKSTSKDEFEYVIRNCADLEIKLAISYKSNGLVSIRKIKQICHKYYRNVDMHEKQHRHSAQGRVGWKVNRINENLIICK